MTLYKTDKVRFISGLIIIIIIYSWYFLYFVENKQTANIPRKIRHIITLLITITVYFVGTYHLGKLKDTWMATIWHIVHISGLFIITSIGLFDWFIGGSLMLSRFAKTIQEILISPVLYVAMGLLNRSLKKES
ncbi:hypothetical protein [Algibacter sp.]|uniref:hypothetical protein n=1 Tax=Algibacter sp. TaxID=1872428 RepID=UPI003C775867